MTHACTLHVLCTRRAVRLQFNKDTECILFTQTQLSFGNDYQRTKRILAALKAAQPHGRGRPHDKVRLGDRDEFKATQGAICWTSTAKAPRPQALVAGRPPPRRQAQNKSYPTPSTPHPEAKPTKRGEARGEAKQVATPPGPRGVIGTRRGPQH